jgi:hypothetical protein
MRAMKTEEFDERFDTREDLSRALDITNVR